MDVAAVWKLVENLQTMTAMTAMTIQKTKLRSVEFKTHPSNELSLENRGNYL
jgi:hypothetical protein